MKNLTVPKSFIAYLGLLAVSFLLLYYQVVLRLVEYWETNPNYSHGYFIPFLAGFMIWSKRQEIFQNEIDPKILWGGLLILAGLLQMVLGSVGTQFFLKATSMIAILLGISLFFWGMPVTLKLLVPILYLIFMIPLPGIIWNQLAFPLSLMASKVAANVIDLMGLSILREGNILQLPNVTLQVAEACSGLRSLTTLFALSALVAYLSYLRRSLKLIIFFSAIPIALVGNVVRLTATAVLARYFGPDMAKGFIHEFSGWVLFVLGLILLIMLHNLLARWSRPKNEAA